MIQKKDDRQEDDENKHSSSEKYLVITLVSIVLIVIITLFAIKYMNRPEYITIEDLHARNLQGKLDPDEGYVYNGFSFVKYQGLWFTQVHIKGTTNLYDIQLHYGPEEVKDIELIGDPSRFLSLPGIFVTFDPKGKDLAHVAVSAGEFSLVSAQVLNVTPISACTKNETAVCEGIDIVRCFDPYPVIYLEESDDTGVLVQDNCIRVKGKGMDLLKATDRLLFAWLKVI
jgi:hypothetical protein